MHDLFIFLFSVFFIFKNANPSPRGPDLAFGEIRGSEISKWEQQAQIHRSYHESTGYSGTQNHWGK